MNSDPFSNKDSLFHQLQSLKNYCMISIIVITVIIIFSHIAVDTFAAYESNQLPVESIKFYTEEKLTDLDGYFEEYQNTLLTEVETIESYLQKQIINSPDDYEGVLEFSLDDDDLLYSYVGLESKEMILLPNTILPDDYDPTLRPWYRDAISNGMTWTSIYLDAATNQPIITLSVPFHHPDTQKTEGVLGIDLSLQNLFDDLSKWQATETGYYVVTDNEGIVLFHPDQVYIGQPVPIEEIYDFITGSNAAGQTEYMYNGQHKLASIFRSQAVDLNVVHIEEIPKFEIVHNNASLILLISGAAILVFLINFKIYSLQNKFRETAHTSSNTAYYTDRKNKEALQQISKKLKEAAEQLEHM